MFPLAKDMLEESVSMTLSLFSLLPYQPTDSSGRELWFSRGTRLPALWQKVR